MGQQAWEEIDFRAHSECTGTIWSLRVEGGRAVDLREEPSHIGQLASFGEGADGTLYAVSVGSGRLFRVVG